MIKKKFYIHTSCTLLETWEVRAENKKDAKRVFDEEEKECVHFDTQGFQIDEIHEVDQ
jgi:cell division ATPase FtsA